MPQRPPVHTGRPGPAPPRDYHRLYGRRWRKLRLLFLHAHPICVECEGRGLIVPATDVDHIVPHRGNLELFWDESNWQALCDSCSNTKSAREQIGAPPRTWAGSPRPSPGPRSDDQT